MITVKATGAKGNGAPAVLPVTTTPLDEAAMHLKSFIPHGGEWWLSVAVHHLHWVKKHMTVVVLEPLTVASYHAPRPRPPGSCLIDCMRGWGVLRKTSGWEVKDRIVNEASNNALVVALFLTVSLPAFMSPPDTHGTCSHAPCRGGRGYAATLTLGLSGSSTWGERVRHNIHSSLD